jgi:carbonic anhydrase/acetyltransferase-like protein (isoleucine patch superfamily)
MAIYKLGDRVPDIAPTAYVHETATVVGDVTLKGHASVWPQAVVRGDTASITIGERSNVQDGSVLHVDEGVPLTIGDDVTIGHQVMLHGCTIGDGSLIGIQAVVLNRAVIGKGCLVGAGALVTEGKVFPDGVMILGSPARVIRELTADDIARVRHGALHYVEAATDYRDHAVRIDVEAAKPLVLPALLRTGS